MTPADLEFRLKIVAPRLLVIAERHLTRLIRRRIDCGITTATAVDLPHFVSRAELLDDDILNERVRSDTPGDYLLVCNPDDLHLESLPDSEVLRFYWRMLFGVSIYKALQMASPQPSDQTILNEARHVLDMDHRCPEGASDQEVWIRFLSLAATRVAFMPQSISSFFPSVGTVEKLNSLMPSSVNPVEILVKTKPPGAAEAVEIIPASKVSETISRLPIPASMPPLKNFVREAINRTRANDSTQAAKSIGDLVRCLQPIIDWDESKAHEWYEALLPLLSVAAHGHWPHAARLLYDLQTLAHDLSGMVYDVDLPSYILSWGKKPIQRPLSHSRDVMILRTLHAVSKHLDRSHLNERDDHRLGHLVEQAIERGEDQIRDHLGEPIRKALTEAGIVPKTTVEHIAREAVVAELLDKICERSFVRFGDLRDAVAKHNLKMADLSGVAEWKNGDALLRADRMLADNLDGVYHRGELYLRIFHRLSSLGFGNRAGRFATRYLILPFAGAFLTLEAAQHIVHGVLGLYGFFSKILAPKLRGMSAANPDVPGIAPTETIPIPDPDDFDPWEETVSVNPDEAIKVFKQIATSTAGTEHTGPHFVTLPAVLILGIVILGLLHWPAFRTAVWETTKLLGRFIRLTLFTLPVAVWNSKFFRAFRNHPISKFLYRRFSTSSALTLIVIGTMWLLGATPFRIARWTLYFFTAFSLFAYTPIGRRVEDGTAGAMADTWKLIRANLIPGIISWFIWIFRELAGAFERMLYSIDEWFRFREGQAKPNLALKAILSLIWFPIAYFARFAFNLLLEPQVNPIKHFPVVTVSHKVLFTTIPYIRDALGVSEATVVGIIWCIPGIFGFLAWEFKENWRLYRATRPKTLQPLAIGHHGESIRGYLRPGFHSGTVPKLFRKMRIAERKSERSGQQADRHRFEHEKHHIAEAVARLVDRQMLSLLRTTAAWKEKPLSVKHVDVTCQTLHVGIDANGQRLDLTFSIEADEIRLIVSPREGVNGTDEQRETWNTALQGLAAYAATPEVVAWDQWEKKW